MFKTVSCKFQSLWQNITHSADIVSAGSKRKRYNDNCDVNDDDDDNPDISIVEKKRKTESSSTVVNTVKTYVCNMTQWLKPKAKRYSDGFHVIPYVKRESAPIIHNGDPMKVPQEMEDRHSHNHRSAVGNAMFHYKDMTSNGGMDKELRDGVNHQVSKCSSIRSVNQHKESTARMHARLLEKEQYQQLLQLHSQHSPRQHQMSYKIPDASSIANELDVISISSESSGDHHQRRSNILMEAKPALGSISIPKHKMTPNSSNLTSVFTSKFKPFQAKSSYDPSHRIGINASYRRPTVAANNDWVVITCKSKGDPYKVNTMLTEVNNKSPSSNQPESIVVIDDDEPVSSEPAKNTAATTQDPLTQKTTDFRIPATFLQSRFMNDKDIEDERRARMEEQRRRKCLIEEAEFKAKAYAEKRRAQEISLDKSLKYQMRIFDDEPQVCEDIFREEEEEEEKMPELTQEMQMIINSALRPGSPNEVLSEDFRLQITRGDIKTLSGLSWLNDEVINFYMNLLMRSGENGERAKLYAFNTFFYPKVKSGGHGAVKRWTKSVNIFAVNYIIIPVHLGVHWCLCVANMEKKVITYYDSMGANNNLCLNAVLQYIHDESKAKGYTAFNKNEWKLVNAEDNPQQMNGGDCGMFMCMYAEYITRGKEITFTQEHMPYFRRRMVYEIISKKLLH